MSMEKLIKPGRVIFATSIMALGVLCFILKDFIIGRPPAWPAAFPLNPSLGYLTGSITIVAGMSILLNKKGGAASLVIAALIFLLSVLRHIPQYMGDWPNTYKSLGLFGGALIIACSFYKSAVIPTTGFMANATMQKNMIAAGCILLAAFFIACGYAHFKYAAFVDSLIPAYIPFHSFWTYFCGICLLAGGVGLIIPQTRKWAALLSGIMVSGWFILLHIPRFLANTNDVSDRLGLCESFAFCGIFFVLAGMVARR